MKVNNFKQTLKYSLLCVRIMQLRENSDFLTKKKQYVTFCLSALVKWNTQAYLKLSFTSHNDKNNKGKRSGLEYNEAKAPKQGILQNQ